MTAPSIFQTGLDILVRSTSVPSWVQDSFTKVVATTSPLFLPFEEKKITLERHPLQNLYHLLERAIQTGQAQQLREPLYALPEGLRKDDLFPEVYSLSTDPSKASDSNWCENHALDDLTQLLKAVKNVVENKLDKLSVDQKNALFGTIYRMAGQPRTDDLQWGEHNATNNTERLIRALNRHQHLEIAGRSVLVYSDLEKGVATPSCCFHLHRKELPRGQMGMHNGMDASFEKAYDNALKISTNCAQGYNLHCTYGATVDKQWDLASAVFSQGKGVTPPVLQLLDRWQDFFESDDSNRLLQICHSRGAIEVNNALSYLSAELRKRILVIAIAPACLINEGDCYKAFNLIHLSDPVVQIASNRELFDAPYTYKLECANKSDDPHYMHDLSYQEKLVPMIDAFIQTNDIC